MKFWSLRILHSVRSSYWFVPTVMLLGSIALGALMVWLDAGPAKDLLGGISWYQQSKPQGAREVLSTIAGSMITVAGVVFSITIVAISFAAGQYGPRILTNFMSDRGNQVTLGTFVATFAYAVVVLRTIHGGDSDFVPHLAVLVALLLALCSIAVLIYFIHHVPESIHINTITARVGRELLKALEAEFPKCFGDPPDRSNADERELARTAERLFGPRQQSVEITARTSGYLQAIDDDHLISAARDTGITIDLRRKPGSFVYRGQMVALAAPADAVNDDVYRRVQRSWTIGSRPTPEQNSLFLIDELVEIAARALSTGLNDPHTANSCVDWLAAGAAEAASRQAPSWYRVDADGILRVVAPAADFEDHLQRGFGQLRSYLARDVNAATYGLSALASLGSACRSKEQRNALLNEVEKLARLAEAAHQGASRALVLETSASARLSLTAAN